MRSPLWFVVAGIIAIAGFAAGIWYAVPRLLAADAAMKRVTVPGMSIVDLDKAGPYTIYIEHNSSVDKKSTALNLRQHLNISLTSQQTGEVVTLSRPLASSVYSVGDHTGVSILAFTIAGPGAYHLVVDSTERVPMTETLAIEQGTAWNFLRVIWGTFVISSIGIAIAGTITGVTIWQRTKAKKAA
jgi:hypothetical protein